MLCCRELFLDLMENLDQEKNKDPLKAQFICILCCSGGILLFAGEQKTAVAAEQNLTVCTCFILE